MKLRRVLAVRIVEALRVRGEFFQVLLADEGGFAEAHPFAFQAAQA